MAFNATALRVMIASPSDVGDARDAVEAAIHEWNNSHAENTGVALIPWRWESGGIPSLSAPPQSLIEAQGVDRSDIVIAIIGARIGEPVDGAISGTVSEIERARLQGKPVHLYFSTGSLPPNVDTTQLTLMREFRAAIAEMGLYGTFADLSDLQRQINFALSADVSVRRAEQPSDYFERNVLDRVYESLDIEWRFTESSTREGTWDGHHVNHHRFIARSTTGVETVEITISRGDDTLPFIGDALNYELGGESSRSLPGRIELREPRVRSASDFAQDIAFVPPLSENEEVDLWYMGQVRGHKRAYLEDIIASSQKSRIGLRDWDFVGYRPEHPVAKLEYSVFLPDSLGATPVGPKVGTRGSVDADLNQALIADGAYSHTRAEVEGQEGWLLRLEVREPNLLRYYRLAWRPPRRA